jgi:hypothetical protein
MPVREKVETETNRRSGEREMRREMALRERRTGVEDHVLWS